MGDSTLMTSLNDQTYLLSVILLEKNTFLIFFLLIHMQSCLDKYVNNIIKHLCKCILLVFSMKVNSQGSTLL